MTKEGIEKLPTLLDVINNQLAKEHRREIKIDNSEHIEELTNFFQSNYFTPIPDNEGICKLFPNKTDFHSYFRGENRYHEQCFPSLFRNGMQEADIFVERLKRCEMKLMMKEYPMTPMIENGIIAVEPSGEQHRLKIKIGYDGLAQHYGIKTEYFDFTSDILTAAFFAATTYDSEKDIYSPITDIEITLIAGRAHLKHTEGGDFREATYRAVRNGLMKARSILLEPIYSFIAIIPESSVGRFLSDITMMSGNATIKDSRDSFITLEGKCPVSTMLNYAITLRSYTKGEGTITTVVSQYDRCHNEDEIINSISYDPLSDLENTPSSVFCSHGAGFPVPWDRVEEYAHIKL